MELSKIEKLAHIVQETGLTLLEVEDEGGRVRLERGTAPACAAPAEGPAQTASPKTEAAAPAPEEDAVDFNRVHEIRSPMVGVFYAAASPEAGPFVSIGSRVKKGDVLCIVEAMKLMNEITADQDGEVVDICAENGQVVEYGQTLFKLF